VNLNHSVRRKSALMKCVRWGKSEGGDVVEVGGMVPYSHQPIS